MKKSIFLIAVFMSVSVVLLNAQNTKYGTGALFSNTTGTGNSAFGYKTLYSNTAGSNNTATGNYTLFSNTTGFYNTATGAKALNYNTTGYHNTATGNYALFSNTAGGKNTAAGYYSLYSNTTGYCNTATGILALYSNTTGSSNTATGNYALYRNTTGYYNTAAGSGTLYNNTVGGCNTAVGNSALYHNTTGACNTALGYISGWNVSSQNNTTSIGYYATATASNMVRIGNSSVTSIGGQVSWSTLSDGRFKKKIKHDVVGLDFINRLEPVSYILDNNDFDNFLKIPDSLRIKSKNAPVIQSGFVAQDVEKLLADMGITNFNGLNIPQNKNDYYSIRYAEFVVPLVKAVQELSALDKEKELKIELLEEKINRLEKLLAGSENVPDAETTIQLNSGLAQNNPNPFSTSTEINCNVPVGAKSAKLMIFDMNGRQLRTIAISERGNCSIQVNADELNGSGMYIYSLFVDNNEISTKRMILSK